MASEESQESVRPGVGEQLRRAREAMGRSCADLAEELRLTEEQIQALEDEDFSRLPAEAYVRGYLRNFAASVGLSPEAVIEAYERQDQPSAGSAHPEDETPLIPEPEKPLIEHPWRVVVISLVLLAAVGGFTVWFLGQGDRGVAPVAQQEGPSESAGGTPEEGAPATASADADNGGEATAEATTDGNGTADAGAPVETTGEPKVPGEPEARPVSEAAGADESGSGTEPSAGAEPAGGQAEAPAPAPTESAEAPAAAEEPVPTAAGGTTSPELPGDMQVLRVRAWADAWMEVADDRGDLLLRRLVQAGSDLRLYGKAPFQVKAGNAAGVQLYFEGRPLAPLGDPGQVVRVNVDADSETIPESEVARPADLTAPDGTKSDGTGGNGGTGDGSGPGPASPATAGDGASAPE